MAFDLKKYLREGEEISFQQDFAFVTKESKENGQIWTRMYTTPTVYVFPINKEEKIWIIHERREGENLSRWKSVGGDIDGDEGPLDAAKRELAEELQMNAKRWELLHYLPFSGKAYNDMRYYYIAKDLSFVEVENPDGDVVLDKKLVTVEELKNQVLEGMFEWSPLSFAILKLWRDLRDGKISLK